MTDLDGSIYRPLRERPNETDSAAWSNEEWLSRLSFGSRGRVPAVAALHALMLRAARHQVRRMPDAATLGAARRDEIAHAAADEATVAALGRLGSFEGRSRFTTWAYKFGILQAGVELRRLTWGGREIYLEELPEPPSRPNESPEAHVEARDLAAAVRAGLDDALTPHQRRVAIGALVDEIPIDVLADRLGTTRNNVYKTLHDARRRLRAYLRERNLLPVETTSKEAHR